MKFLRLLLLPAAATIVTAAYTLNWSTIDSGGGLSTGGTYTVAGTIGQADTTRMSGGAYALSGGFWALPELLQTPEGPPLTMTSTPSAVLLQWPSPSPGWRLLTSTDLLSWTPVANAPILSGDYLQVTQSPVPGGSRRFYRLTFP